MDGKTNQITQFAPLLQPLDLAGCVITADALCRRRHNASKVTTTPARSRGPRSSAKWLVSLCFTSTSRWRRRDQSGNSRAAAERNAAAERVADRVELVDADARDLPFVSASFDLVVSSLAISNIRQAGGRAQALREAVRVLRPGGRLRIVDDGAGRYAAALQDAGCTDVAVRQLDWRTWYGLPGHHLPLVAAARPPG